MVREFVFADPEQLKEANTFANGGNCTTCAGVWNISRKCGRTVWDGRIFARFEAHGNAHAATIYRVTNGERREICELKYTPALHWCKENLEMTSFIESERKKK